MRLLVVTQAVDQDDQALGFFHDWIAALAARTERVTVICLYEGRHDLPENVAVHSLGKERSRVSHVRYAARFLALAWQLRATYDTVCVHMNQEYVLLAGSLWKALGKRVALWRNHARGSFATSIAIALTDRVFVTSSRAYAAPFEKAKRMPVGIAVPEMLPTAARDPRALLYVGRLDPVKRIEIIIDACALLQEYNHRFSLALIGAPTPGREAYAEQLAALVRERKLGDAVTFRAPIPHAMLGEIYATQGVVVNATLPGSYDKTILEAAAYGCLSVACTDTYVADAPPACVYDGTAAGLAETLDRLLALPEEDSERLRTEMRALAARNSLAALADALADELAALHPHAARTY